MQEVSSIVPLWREKRKCGIKVIDKEEGYVASDQIIEEF